jgi:hypothetical protein
MRPGEDHRPLEAESPDGNAEAFMLLDACLRLVWLNDASSGGFAIFTGAIVIDRPCPLWEEPAAVSLSHFSYG